MITLTDWIKALKSSKYKQGTKRLRTSNEFCCLGVLCDLHKCSYEDEHGFLTSPDGKTLEPCSFPLDYVREVFNLKNEDNVVRICYDLANANDNGFDFKEIAEALEKASKCKTSQQIEKVFDKCFKIEDENEDTPSETEG